MEVVASREELEALDCTGPPPGNPFRSVGQALWKGFCAPPQTVVVNSASSPASDNSVEDSSIESENNDHSPIIQVGPLGSLKKLLTCFCDPLDVSRSPCSTSLAPTHSWDSNELAREKAHEDQEEEFEEVVAVTKPGTRRIVRVMKGLETFFVALGLVVLTLYALRRIDTDLGFELIPVENNRGDSSFFSITSRAPPTGATNLDKCESARASSADFPLSPSECLLQFANTTSS